MSLDHYQLLDISTQATSEEIKRAYARTIRKHQKDADRLAQIHTAYATLSDPKARAQYDTLLQHGGEIEKLMEQVRGCFEREEWPEAIRLLKKACVLAPEVEEAQNQLGLAFSYNEQYDEAQRVFEKLTGNASDVPLYWQNLGAVLRAKAKGLEQGTQRKGELISRAIRAFETAHELEPLNQQDFLEVAKCHQVNGNKQIAASWAERAIGETLDYAALEALSFLVWMYIADNDTLNLNSIVTRICSITPDQNEDLQKIVTYRLASIADEVWTLVRDKQYYDLLKYAAILMRYTRKFDAQTEELSSFYELITYCSDAYDEHERFTNDDCLSDGFKNIGRYMLAEMMGEDVKSWNWGIDDAIKQFESLSKNDMLTQLDYFRELYAATYWISDNLLDRIEEALTEEERVVELKPIKFGHEHENNHLACDNYNIKTTDTTNNYNSNNSGNGCLFIIGVIVVIVGILGVIHVITIPVALPLLYVGWKLASENS